MTRIEYKGYIGEVTIDEESGWLCADTIGMQGGATAEAETFAQLKEEFATSIEDYLAVCAERGITPERSFSGRFQVRTTPEIHRLVVAAAQLEGKSLNQFAGDALAEKARATLPNHDAEPTTNRGIIPAADMAVS
ncbi:MAG: type II toxin-antitoxin system HicB family antitoxin [Cyanobacteria bacterium J06639_1]